MRPVLVLILAIAATGCLGTTPESSERASLGVDPSGRENGPEHRAGQPCLVCHSERGGTYPYFALAGTVYGLDGTTGRKDVEVTVVGADAEQFVATTNSVGNFMVAVNGSLNEPKRYARGVLEIPAEPDFPLTVDISDGDNMFGMRSPIHREGSCSKCHTKVLSATSAGPIVIGAEP